MNAKAKVDGFKFKFKFLGIGESVSSYKMCNRH